MQIYRLKALSDNYIFLLHDPNRNVAAVVDPAEAQPVLEQKESGILDQIAKYSTRI
jgi:hydroxyacylglutathione hydrolase